MRLGPLVAVRHRAENLLPAAENIGVTHFTNGCFRLHPVEWNVGAVAGTRAAFCLGQRTMPRGVRNPPHFLANFQ